MTKGVSGIDGSEGDDGEEGDDGSVGDDDVDGTKEDRLREGVAVGKASLLGRARFNDETLLCNNGEETGVVQPDSDGKEAVENDGNGSVEEGAAVEL